MLDHLSLEVPSGLARCQSHAARLVKRIEHLAIDIQLKLVGGSIANPHRSGVLITAEPANFVFGQAAFSVQAASADSGMLRKEGDQVRTNGISSPA